jgi:hypothetical protein
VPAVQVLFERNGLERHVWIVRCEHWPSSSRLLVGGAASADGRSVGPGVRVLRRA